MTDTSSGALGFWKRNALILKGALVCLLTLLLLIPQTMIQGIIQERSHRQQAAVQEVGQKWATQQTLTGPVLTVPYYAYSTNGAGQPVRKLHHAYFMPEELRVNGELTPQKRHRSIFEITVYQSDLQLNGSFLFPDLEKLNLSAEQVLWDDISLNLGISDLRGIENALAVTWGQEELVFNPGTEAPDLMSQGVKADIHMEHPDSTASPSSFSFSIRLQLKGSQYLYVAPVGKKTSLQLASAWPDPSFSGAFLPDSHKVTPEGFQAEWEVLHLNRNFPQQWKGRSFQVAPSTFGVELLIPADGYQRSMRSVKYAILFIALTFIVFFFLEVMNGVRVHPVQYTLIGMALIIFYTLLVSLSEQWTFNAAYAVSSTATVALVASYVHSIFHKRKITALFIGILAALYGFIFTIIQLEDLSLLAGSIGLFVILALLMYYSRNVDWYKAYGQTSTT